MDRSGADAMRVALADLLCLGLLLVAGLSLRLPALDVVALNPDESQYEAAASYWVEGGGSEYDHPQTVGGGFTIYRIATEIFGNYPTVQIRLLILFINWIIAVAIFAMVRWDNGRLAGLIAASVFLHYNLAFEGYSANHEWFSVLPLVLAAGLFLLADRAAGRRSLVLYFAAGLIAGTSLWFKAQAIMIVFFVPALLLFDLLGGRTLRSCLSRLTAYGSGGLLAGGLYLLPFAFVGNLGDYLDMVSHSWSSYVVSNARQATAATSAEYGYFWHLYWKLPSRGLLTLAYGFALWQLVDQAARRMRRGAAVSAARRQGLLATFLLIGALLAIQLGSRYFEHYYLFMVPAVGLLVGEAFVPDGGPRRGVALALLGAYSAERLVAIGMAGPLELLRALPAATPLVLHAVAALAIPLWVALSPRARAHPGLLAVIVLETVMLVVPVQLSERPRSLPHHSRGFDGVVQYLVRNSVPTDRLFVWGWCPEIYSLTRLTAASDFTTVQYVVGDFEADSQPRLNHEIARQLMAELHRSRPRYIVDAARRSWTMARHNDPKLYDLDLYPDFELTRWLREDYVTVGTYDDCVIYRRKAAPG